MIFFYILPSLLLGWSLGTNNACHIFGPPVVSGLVSYKKVRIVSAIFVFLGAVVGGKAGLKTLSQLTNLDIRFLSLSLFCAFLSMFLMTLFALPASATQAVVGSLIGATILKGEVNLGLLVGILVSWLLTPVGAMFFSFVLYNALSLLFRKFLTIAGQDRFIKILTWIVIIYSSYSLGANNVANVTGVFADILFTPTILTMIGGIAIAVGILTTNQKVLHTVGKGILEMDHFSSAISIFGVSISLWIFSLIGIPVSATQAIIGSIIGVGLATGTKTFDYKLILKIVFGWIGTPLASGLISFLIIWIFKL
ncbi:MAG TPA: inorganic phosphate transporter [Defluviitoga sp.]|nr:inorganic phosphate transporter [Defluviitoga sp.]HOP24701.1 inorganic phosphate transporter [Defluviitoga sp.]HPZ29120.1 inorganic phosphate transporter [Defluviitoga sp.]HQD63026.1 inorganic phosphate transporter [Defluviitoga sp.]